jgi:hypothetical protein
MKMSPPKRHPLAMELFKKAKAYQISAERLCERFFGNEPVIGIPMSDPIYYLYHHSAELALKALLLSNNIRPGKEHRITVLLRKCREGGLLIIDNNDQLARNLSLSVLSEDKGYNYRTQLKSRTTPIRPGYPLTPKRAASGDFR